MKTITVDGKEYEVRCGCKWVWPDPPLPNDLEMVGKRCLICGYHPWILTTEPLHDEFAGL